MCAAALTLALALSACADAPSTVDAEGHLAHSVFEWPPRLAPFQVATEAGALRAALRAEVPEAELPSPAQAQNILQRAERAIAGDGIRLDRPQLILVVDRNPLVQRIAVVLARPGGSWESLGAARVSTGQAGRRGYFITPTGVFPHTPDIADYRAEGTFNAQGIRGLGLRGMRVWDFGWVPARRGWAGPDAAPSAIRLLLHATDPDMLEQRLGQPASQGCVRIPAAMNRFLDRHGVLDADHERAARGGDVRALAALRADRTPTPLAGRLMVVVDSSAAPEAAPKRAASRPPLRAEHRAC